MALGSSSSTPRPISQARCHSLGTCTKVKLCDTNRNSQISLASNSYSLQYFTVSYYLLSLQLSQHNLGCGVDELAMSTGNHLWLKQCCDRIEELQCLIKANASTGKRSVDIPWSWMCKELFSLLARYPTGVTNAIILSELQMLWSDGNSAASWQDGECKKISITDFVQSRFISPEAILEGTLTLPHALPGTNIPLAWLKENPEADKGASLEMYLHQKFYQHPQLQTNSRVRLTRCRLQQSQNAGVRNTSTSRSGPRAARHLLPTDIMVFLSDCESLMMDGFSTQLSLNQISSGYGSPILFRVSRIAPVVTVHSPDGSTSQQLCVTLSDDAGTSIGLILWDDHLQLAQLFKKGDWLGIEKPYYQLYNNEMYVEYGPASVFYCVPFVPSTASESQCESSSVLGHSAVLTDDEGIASLAAYPHRLQVYQLQPRTKAITLCIQIMSKSPLKQNQSGTSAEEFTLDVADHTGSACVHISNHLSSLYHHFQPGQCVVLCGLSSVDTTAATAAGGG
eukprot:scpid80288/ scgid0849/ 